jgi:hypothetical protein
VDVEVKAFGTGEAGRASDYQRCTNSTLVGVEVGHASGCALKKSTTTH